MGRWILIIFASFAMNYIFIAMFPFLMSHFTFAGFAIRWATISLCMLVYVGHRLSNFK